MPANSLQMQAEWVGFGRAEAERAYGGRHVRRHDGDHATRTRVHLNPT
jgi:hypothetical protein